MVSKRLIGVCKVAAERIGQSIWEKIRNAVIRRQRQDRIRN